MVVVPPVQMVVVPEIDAIGNDVIETTALPDWFWLQDGVPAEATLTKA